MAETDTRHVDSLDQTYVRGKNKRKVDEGMCISGRLYKRLEMELVVSTKLQVLEWSSRRQMSER